MPLTADDVIQENSGVSAAASASMVVTLPSGTTAGNTVVVIAGTQVALTPPAGFVADKNVSNIAVAYRKSDVAAGETSWTFTMVSSFFAWYAVELSNVELAEPLDVSANSTAGASVSNGGTLSTGTAPLNAALNTMLLGAFVAPRVSGSTESWSGYTNGFEEVADLAATHVSGQQLAVARKFIDGTTGTFEATGTLATTQAPASATAMLVAYRAADSKIVAPLAHFLGFDWLTHGGIHSHTGATNMLGSTLNSATGTWGTNYSIGVGSARNSAGGLQVTTSAAATYVYVGTLSNKVLSVGLNVRVVSATGTAVVAEFYYGAVAAQLLYDSSATKLGVRCGTTGTAAWESGTTALNTWRWVDLRVKTGATTWTVDWQIETGANIYTAQASASLGGQSVVNVSMIRLGSATSQTMTADYDDLVISAYSTVFPLGPHEVKLLTVDPAGTPSVSGTTTNFSVFTANTTLGAWNAANARNAVDEVPPTISASSDGVTQTAVGASDYIELPMSTYTAGPAETIVGVRMLAPLWSGTGAGAGDLAIRGWDGTTETALATASQITPGSATTTSSTVPVWRAAMWQSINGWTQAELDAAAVRVGFSGDATPDMGVHAVYLEVAVGRARTQQLFGDLASMAVDPNRGGTVAVTVVAPTGYDTTLHYEESGTPTDVPVTGGASVTEQINATFEADVNYIAAYPAPEPDPVD